MGRAMLGLLAFFAFIHGIRAIGQDSCVSFTASRDAFPVVNNRRATPILISADDWPGVQIAASDFAADIKRVTSITPSLTNHTVASTGPASSAVPSLSASESSLIPSASASAAADIVPRQIRPAPASSTVIIVGTLGKSSLINEVVKSAGIDVSSIEGKWESFVSQVVENPLPGVSKAYVIIGSDKRGTIFGLYEHSEQFGVSPWYWWADVPSTPHSSLFITGSGCSHGEPTVKYRGIFLNDEQPALQNWAMEKFTNGTGAPLSNSPFNHHFYIRVYELILRLKGNYLWPALWGSAFALDDPLNQFLADRYGVVMGTSHQEPMLRSTPNEFSWLERGKWDYTTNTDAINQYWLEGVERGKNFESIYTLGMRGFGDLPLSDETNIALLQSAVNNQTEIFRKVFGSDVDIATIPQVWTLYKEVEKYYEDGMRVEDYITLLWADDNWGNIRRLPYPAERNRTGGAGVYYHFDYVGDPRDYKWISTNQLEKVYQQMSLALERSADRLWIVNVGDLKPVERETEFFLSLGYDASRWNHTTISSFVHQWATREFDLTPERAAIVTSIVANVTRFNARRKPEMIETTLYSLWNYREADNILASWSALEKASTSIYNSLPSAYKPAYFQLVHHPVIAAATVGKIYIYAGLNNLRATQARLVTNDLADTVEELFERDYEIEQQYHGLLNGKWNHMASQTHLGYSYWQQPMTNTMPAVNRVHKKKQALSGLIRIGLEGAQGAWPGDNPYQCALGYNCPPPTVTLDNFSPISDRYIDIGAGGPDAYSWTSNINATWLKLSPASGSISPRSPETRVYASVVDWSSLPAGVTDASIHFTATAPGKKTTEVDVIFRAIKNSPPNGYKGKKHKAPSVDPLCFLAGFVEGTGVISIEAAHATRKTNVDGIEWTELPGIGRTLSGVSPLPFTDQSFSEGNGPLLEYDFYNFNTIEGKGNLNVTIYMTPAFNFNNDDHPLAYSVQLDSGPAVKVVPLDQEVPGNYPSQWKGHWGMVANNSVATLTPLTGVTPGAHTLKIGAIEGGVVLEKIVIDAGGLVKSYLGPPESVSL